MPSDEKDNPGRPPGGDAPDQPRRPARTIDLEAEEVEVEITSGEGGADGDASSAAPGEDQPDQPGGEPQTGSQTASDGTGETAGSGGAASGADGGEERSAPPPPQRSGPPEVRRFVTHLAAGLVGGLVGVLAAGIGLDRLPGILDGGGGDATARLEQRLDALGEKVTAQEQRLETAARQEAVDALDSRIAKLENAPAPEASLPDDLAARLARLENTLETLRESGGAEGASGLARSAALSGRVEEVAQNAETRSARLEGRIGALEERIAALSGNGTQAGPAQTASGSALALAVIRLRRAVAEGEPFAGPLETVRRLAPDGIDFSTLAAHADRGVASPRALLDDLLPVLADARDASAEADGETLLDRLASSAQSVVRVRRVGPEQGGGASAVLSRMEARMEAADLAGTVREAKGLGGPAAERVQPWLEKASARLDAASALDALESRLLDRLGTSAAPGAQR